MPVGLEDVSKFPNLFAELIRRGYSDEDLQKIARLNIIRVFKGVEAVSLARITGYCYYKSTHAGCLIVTCVHTTIQVRDSLKSEPPDNTLISPEPTNITCRPDF